MNTVPSPDDLGSPLASPLPTPTGTPVMAAVQLALAPGEHLVACAKAVLVVGEEESHDVYIALSHERILTFIVDDLGGVALASADDRSTCGVINQHEREDGSLLVVLRQDTGRRCLYFDYFWRAEAGRILDEVDLSVRPEPAAPRANQPEVDTFELRQEFGGLLERLDEDEG